MSGSRAVQPDMTAFLRGGEITLGEMYFGQKKSKVPWITGKSDAKFFGTEEQKVRMHAIP